MFKNTAIGLIILAVLVINLLHFWKLDTIPYGYHVDEVGSAVTLQCMVEKGCDAEIQRLPVFAAMEYGQDKPPTYIYPGMMWGRLFGTTVASLRAYSVFMLTLGILGLFFCALGLRGIGFAAAVVLAATCSPWVWVMTRVALESFFAPVFAIWGLYFFWRPASWWSWSLAGFFWACAMYAYPPARLQIPLMMVTIGAYECQRRRVPWSSVAALAGVFLVSLVPMVSLYMNGQLSQRFVLISIFNHDYLQSLGKTGSIWDLTRIFFHNYALHLSPDFLFFRGDPSYVHSTRHMGILSGLDIAALIILAVFLCLAVLRPGWRANPVIQNRGWLIFLVVNILIGIVPSALTNQELPHALRICGAWPFMMLLTGSMWFWAAESVRLLWPVLAVCGAICGGLLVFQYFTVYQQESKGMFAFWIKDAAEKLQTQEDWQKFMLVFHRKNYHIRYFLVHRLGLTCKQANDLWWQVHDDLDKRGMF